MTAMHGRANEADDQSLENFLDFWIGHLDASCLDHLFIIHGSDTYAAVAQHIEYGLVLTSRIVLLGYLVGTAVSGYLS